jgi:monovalent cation:proton antiporter-2 (CPA2) family protein
MEHSLLSDIVALLATAVVIVPLFQRLRLGTVLGYLTSGILLGPSVSSLITDVAEIRHFAELGVMFLLFLIGIEMKPARLWAMRRAVFGLGAAQVLVTGLVLSGLAFVATGARDQALLIGFALALSSTAMGIQLLSERGELGTSYGRSSFAVLLFQDLSVVPLLGVVPLMVAGQSALDPAAIGLGLLEVAGMVAAVVLVGRYLFQRLLHVVAASRTQEVFIAASLLVVLGTAMLVGTTGLSMALGAFLAGLLLSESPYRHQVMIDIQPFRGLLLGLFFMAVGMSVDLRQLADNFGLIAAAVLALMALKAGLLILLCRVFGMHGQNALATALLLSQSGEFAFVLFGLAEQNGVLPSSLFQQLILIVALSMAATPLLMPLLSVIRRKVSPAGLDEMQGAAVVEHVIITGFGRVGQRVARVLDEAGLPYLAIDHDADKVEEARAKGFVVIFGEAERLEALRLAGIEHALLLVSTLNNMRDAERLVTAVRREFPSLPIIARAHDRAGSQQLMAAGANRVVSETLEASLQLSADALELADWEIGEIRGIISAFREKHYGSIRTLPPKGPEDLAGKAPP